MLEIRALNKTFFNGRVKHEAVCDLNLTIQKGEIFSLLGPSGCGKTTLLRMIAGLEFPTSGDLFLNGQSIVNWPAQQRPFHMVFQKYALFPHLTVFENVAFGLKLRKVPQQEIESRVEEVLQLVHMTSFKERRPETLSGGQAQRIAIARALVNRPEILLLDEPLSALDQKLREHMQAELKELQKTLGLTFVYVTHDQEEALALSDRIAVLNQGRLEQISQSQKLYQNPESLFSAQFVGSMTQLQVQTAGHDQEFSFFNLCGTSLKARSNPQVQGKCFLMIRPEKIQLSSQKPAAFGNHVEGVIEQEIFRGSQTELIVRLPDNQKLRAFAGSEKLKPGSTVHAIFDAQDCFLFKDVK